MIASLRRVTKDAGRKVVLILGSSRRTDKLRGHHARPVRAWVEAHRHEIELCQLPAYAPDHSRDEYLSNDRMQKLRERRRPGSKGKLPKGTRAVLRAVQRSPDPRTRMGALVDESHARRVMGFVDAARAVGATIAIEGARARQETGGAHVQTTVLEMSTTA